MLSCVSASDLISVLAVNIQDNNIRKKNEQMFEKMKTMSGFVCELLRISIKDDIDQNIALNASIQMKNFINSNWKFTSDKRLNDQLALDDDEKILISDTDKNFIRNNILEAIKYSLKNGRIKIFKQYTQAIKKMIKLDYDTPWKNELMLKIEEFMSSNEYCLNYGGVCIFNKISKKFEYEEEEEVKKYNQDLTQVMKYLLSFLTSNINTFSSENSAVFLYKLYKIFFKSFQSVIPEILKKKDVYLIWSNCMLKVLEFNMQNINSNNNSIYWKVKDLCFQIITRIVQKYLNKYSKKQSGFNISDYIYSYFTGFKLLYENYVKINSNTYINDTDIQYIYNFFSHLMDTKEYAEEVCKVFMAENVREKMIDQIIKDSIRTPESLSDWVNEPKKYLSEEMNDVSSFFTKRYAAYKMMHALLSYNKGEYYGTIMSYLSSTLSMSVPKIKDEEEKIRQNFSPKIGKVDFFISDAKNVKFSLLKESILFLLEMNSHILIKNSPSDLENLIKNFVFPDLSSVVGFLREKACDVLTKFKEIKYKDEKMVEEITKKLCFLMQNDGNLVVRVFSGVAASAIAKQESARRILAGNAKQIIEIYVMLMEETEFEEIFVSIQSIVKYFKEEANNFFSSLFSSLTRKFLSAISAAEEKEEAAEDYNLVSSLLLTFTDILRVFPLRPPIAEEIKSNIKLILDYCFISDPYDKLEDGLDLLGALFVGAFGADEQPPQYLWEYFPIVVGSVCSGGGEGKGEKNSSGNNSNHSNNSINLSSSLLTGPGFDSLHSVSSTILKFAFWDKEKFFAGKNSEEEKKNSGNSNNIYNIGNDMVNCSVYNGVRYFDMVVDMVKNITKICIKRSNFDEFKYAAKILAVIFDLYIGRVDNLYYSVLHFFSEYENVFRIKNKKNTENSKNAKFSSAPKFPLKSSSLLSLLSTLVLYSPTAAAEERKVAEILIERAGSVNPRKSPRVFKFVVLALTSLLSLAPNEKSEKVRQFLEENFAKIFECTVSLIMNYNSKNENSNKKNENSNSDNLNSKIKNSNIEDGMEEDDNDDFDDENLYDELDSENGSFDDDEYEEEEEEDEEEKMWSKSSFFCSFSALDFFFEFLEKEKVKEVVGEEKVEKIKKMIKNEGI